jgi:hypothetical protein
MTKLRLVTVSNVRTKDGETINGQYEFVREEESGHAIIRHPKGGLIRIPRANTDLPATSPATVTYEELTENIRERFRTMERLLKGMIDGTTRSIIVSGAPGVGKTYNTDASLVRNIKFIKVTATPISFYQTLYENRREGDVIVLDDADSVLETEEGANMLKHATDTLDVRTVSYNKESSILADKGVPREFEYNGAIFAATNKDWDREIASGSKMQKHYEALLDRAIYLDLGLHSKQALMARVEDVCRTTSMLKDKGLDDQQIEMLLGWLKDNYVATRTLSLRTAVQLAGMILAQPESWKFDAKMTLLTAKSR